MDVVVSPSASGSEKRALLVALARVGVRPPGAESTTSAWLLAGLREAVDRGGRDDVYALSPRSTRGATRA